MNILILSALALAAPFTVLSQSVCNNDEAREDAILTICEHSKGMAPRPQPRLYLRVLKDGRAQLERNKPIKLATLELQDVFINGTEVQDIVRFGHKSDFQSARDEYPTIRRGIDSSTETTVTFRGLDGVKIITLRNYAPSAPDNYLHYPDSLNRLMYLAEEVRLRAFGMRRSVPAITYCEALKNRRQFLGKRVSIYADLDYTGTRAWLTDECTLTVTGAILPRRLGVDYNELGKKYGSVREVIENAKAKPFYGRARLLATGRLDDNGVGEDLYTFEIDEYLDFQQLVLPYQGLLKPGWTYSHTFINKAPLLPDEGWQPDVFNRDDAVVGAPHQTTRIEWTNMAEFPRLRKPGLTGITFYVLSATTKRVTKTRWNTTYTCEILKVEK